MFLKMPAPEWWGSMLEYRSPGIPSALEDGTSLSSDTAILLAVAVSHSGPTSARSPHAGQRNDFRLLRLDSCPSSVPVPSQVDKVAAPPFE